MDALVGLADAGVGFEVFADLTGAGAVGMDGQEHCEFQSFGSQWPAVRGDVLDPGFAEHA